MGKIEKRWLYERGGEELGRQITRGQAEQMDKEKLARLKRKRKIGNMEREKLER